MSFLHDRPAGAVRHMNGSERRAGAARPYWGVMKCAARRCRRPGSAPGSPAPTIRAAACRPEAPEPVNGYLGQPVARCRIRQMREARGWSQSALALTAGVSRTTVGDYERGRTTPLPGTLARLAEALGVRVADLSERAPVGGSP